MAIRSSSIFSTYGMNSNSNTTALMQNQAKSWDNSVGGVLRFDTLGMELSEGKERKEESNHRQTLIEKTKKSQSTSNGTVVSESQRRRLQSENLDDKKSILKSNSTLSSKSIRTSSQE